MVFGVYYFRGLHMAVLRATVADLSARQRVRGNDRQLHSAVHDSGLDTAAASGTASSANHHVTHVLD